MSGLDKAANSQPQGLELGTAGDFLRSAAYSAMVKPVEGASQIAHAVSFGLVPEAKFQAPDQHSLMSKAGNIAGSVADFVAISRFVGNRFAAAGVSDSIGTTFLREGVAGAAYETLMPTNEQGNFWLNKTRDAGVGFGTFGVMGAGAKWMGGTGMFARLGENSLMRDVALNGAAGVLGGTTHAELNGFAHGHVASALDVANDALNYGVFGAAMGGVNHGLGAVGRFAEARRSSAANPLEINASVGESGGGSKPAEEVDLSDIPGFKPKPTTVEASDTSARATDTVGLNNTAHSRAMDFLLKGADQSPKQPGNEFEFSLPNGSGTVRGEFPARWGQMGQYGSILGPDGQPMVGKSSVPELPLTRMSAAMSEGNFGMKTTAQIDGRTEPVTLGTRRVDSMAEPTDKISTQGQYLVKFPREKAQINLEDGRVGLRIDSSVPTERAYEMAMATEFTRLAFTDSAAAQAARSVYKDSVGFSSQQLVHEWHPDSRAFEQASEGSVAYVRQQPGNPYTEYLNERFGQWPSQDALRAIEPKFSLVDFTPDETPWRREWMATHPYSSAKTTDTTGLSGMMREFARFDNGEIADPRLRLLAYHYAIDPVNGPGSLDALGVATKFHSVASLENDPGIVRTYKEMRDAGWTPDQATSDGQGFVNYGRYVGGQEVPLDPNSPPHGPELVIVRHYFPPQEYYAARALSDARSEFAPNPQEHSQVMPTPENLQAILGDRRYVTSAPPQVPLALYVDLANAQARRAALTAPELPPEEPQKPGS